MAISVVDKKELILYFDTEIGRKNFLEWYSRHGSSDSQYFQEQSSKDWIYLKRPEESCPKCEFYGSEVFGILSENKDKRKVELVCGQCGHKYKAWNSLFEKVKA